MRSDLAWLSLTFAVACGRVEADVPCTTAAQCTDPAAPFCVDMQCVAACGTDGDCTTPGKNQCASDGMCVGCETAADCTAAAAAVCDTGTRECRGCEKDSECTSGVCVEAEGTCATESDVAFVTMMGNDTGTCTRAAPCATVKFALTQAGGRRVVHVLGGSLAITETIALTGDRVLDGEDTSLSANITAINVAAPANAIIEGFRLAAPNTMLAAVTITGAGAKARLDHVDISGDAATLLSTGNTTDVTITRSHFGSLTSNTNQVACQNSIMRVDRSVFETTFVGPSSGTCDLTITRNRFESARDRSVLLSGGHLVMENNLIIHRDGFNDSISVGSLGAGSTIRFNTIVNTTALPSDGAALNCDNTAEVTSNVFAYNSGHPIVGQGCATRFSIFDDQATTAAGTGNKLTDIETIFVNRSAGDFHLSATSPARGAAEPGLTTMVTSDFEGHPRPDPAGDNADAGAFEAP